MFKYVLVISLFILSCRSAIASDNVISYKLTSSCIQNLSISKSEYYDGYWEIKASFSPNGAKLIHSVTSQSLGKKLLLVAADGASLGLNPSTIQAPISSSARMFGYKSEQSAQAAVKKIEQNDSPCGLYLTNY